MTKKKHIINWIFTIITAVIMFTIINKMDIKQFSIALSNLNYFWLALGVLSVIISWFVDAFIIKKLLYGLTKKVNSFKQNFKYSMTGLFYTAISPFGSAGQPMQIMNMHNDKIPMGKTIAATTIKYFTEKIAMVIIFLFFFAFSCVTFYTNNSIIFWFSILAFALNLIILIVVSLLLVKPSIAEKIFVRSIYFIHKIKLIKNIDKKINKIHTIIDDYSSASIYVKEKKAMITLLSLLSILKRILLIIVPYFLYKAFGFSAIGIFEVMSMNVLMSFAITLMPTPGGSLAAEGGFNMIFNNMFGTKIIPAMIIWRFLTYYLIIASGSIFILTTNLLKKIKKNKSIETHLGIDIVKQLT